jgi:hypothetical protein
MFSHCRGKLRIARIGANFFFCLLEKTLDGVIYQRYVTVFLAINFKIYNLKKVNDSQPSTTRNFGSCTRASMHEGLTVVITSREQQNVLPGRQLSFSKPSCFLIKFSTSSIICYLTKNNILTGKKSVILAKRLLLACS